MGTRRKALSFWLGDRRAVTAVEYGLIASALAFTLVAIFSALGTPLGQIFTKVSTKI